MVIGGIALTCFNLNVVTTIVNNPPVITIFIACKNYSQSWVVYYCFTHINHPLVIH